MQNKNYNWKRFWNPREKGYQLSFQGYLWDPEDNDTKSINPDLKSFDKMEDTPCLVLLGEPGIGKTTSIEVERKRIGDQILNDGGKLLWYDLKAYSSDGHLVYDIFKNDDFLEWKKGSFRLHLFLDSLDEGRLRINSISNLLQKELNAIPTDRLFLRIACRTAVWPQSLEETLIKLWGKENVGIYELVPLRKIDIRNAAQANYLDPDAFLKEIKDRDAIPLAIKPVTLNFLINTYKSKKQLPSTQTELYQKGCWHFCEEKNISRRESQLTGNLSTNQRMMIASRIAAVIILANKSAIWIADDPGNLPNELVTIEDLCVGDEIYCNDRAEVNRNNILEVLDTGLFSSQGSYQMGFAHKTYTEFLAAWYLAQHNFGSPQESVGAL